MFKIKSYIITLVFAFCVVWFTGAADLAAEEKGEDVYQPVAEVSIGSNGIGWSPKVEYAYLVLTVSAPDGSVFSKTFKSGSSPYLDASGLRDGLYTYELRVTPDGKQDRKPGAQGEDYTPKALLQSGAFRIEKEGFVIPESSGSGAIASSESSTSGSPSVAVPQAGDDIAITEDVCYADDLIVDGSLCVGFDCVCNYSFGFDTIVLKENNLRIFFDDTSTAASFPRNDWRIIINDSANGGASYFGVEDSSAGRRVFTLEAGAPTHSLYVDDGGRVGFGTSTPVLELHVKDGDTPALRLEQDGSSGFAPQTWDVAGNETSFFIRDATNGSTLPFRIRPGASSNTLTIDADDDIGMGTISPAFPLHMMNADGATAVFEDTTNGTQAQISAGDNFVFIGSKTDHEFRLTVNDSPVITMETSGEVGIGEVNPSFPLEVGTANGAHVTTGGVWTNGSSREYKENIAELSADDAVEALEQLTPVTYEYKKEKGEKYVGFIAEDVPELVAQNDRKSLSPMDVVAVLTKVTKEQQKTISELKDEIAELKKKVEK